jgi:hypothetical protein
MWKLVLLRLATVAAFWLRRKEREEVDSQDSDDSFKSLPAYNRELILAIGEKEHWSCVSGPQDLALLLMLPC